MTFDIELTSRDKDVTATLTNIVNPDPFYTLYINGTDKQVASHNFKSSDTNVSLEWQETSFGTKTYTVKLNGTTSSTESIKLKNSRGRR